MITRLEDVELEMAVAGAATVTATLLPMTWQQTMVSASDWVGLTLPGMIELPGSFSGSLSSPKPQRGPEPSSRMSLAIFIRLAASTLSAPCSSTMASWAASASNLLGAVTNGRPVIVGDLGRERLGEALLGVEAGADRGAALGQLVDPRQGRLHPLDAVARSGSRSRRTPGPSVSGVASWRWVRPILTMSANVLALARRAPRAGAPAPAAARARPARPRRRASRSGRCRSRTGRD